MDIEKVKDIFFLTTKRTHLPQSINRTDERFLYFVDLLNQRQRWDLIVDFENVNTGCFDNYVAERADIINGLCEEKDRKTIAKNLTKIKYTYPLSFFDIYTREESATYISIDLQQAWFQACHYFGIFEEGTWEEYLSKFTNNDFMINHDTQLPYDYATASIFPSYRFAYKEMLWRAYNGGLSQEMNNYNCVFCGFKGDTLCYKVNGNIESCKDIYTGVTEYDGVKVHKLIYKLDKKTFQKDDGTILRFEVTENIDGDVNVIPNNTPYYPQVIKEYLKEELVDNDFHFVSEDTTDKIKCID